MQIAEKQNKELGFKNGAICVCCQENHKRNDNQKKRSHQGYVWKYKSDISQKLIADFELGINNTKIQKDNDIQSESDNEAIRELLSELRDNKIDKELPFDDTCILSPMMIDELIKYKPISKEEFASKISSELRKNLNREQMIQFQDEIFEILEEFDE